MPYTLLVFGFLSGVLLTIGTFSLYHSGKLNDAGAAIFSFVAIVVGIAALIGAVLVSGDINRKLDKVPSDSSQTEINNIE